MLALTTASLYLSYIIPIALLIHKRRTAPGSITFGPWTLGKWGMPVNIFAVLFCAFTCIFVPFPTKIPVTIDNMPWAGPVLGGLTIILVFDWFIRGRNHFKGPLKELLLPVGDATREARRRNS